MSKRENSLVWPALAVIGFLIVAPHCVLAQQTLRIAEVENLGNTLVFHPTLPFARLILTVSGPCDFQYQQRTTEGDPSFSLDATTIDGVYTYNLMREEEIDPGVIEVLLEARTADDPEVPKALCRAGKLPSPPRSQSEGFQVFQGEIVYDPVLVEDPGRLPAQSSGSSSDGGANLVVASPGATANFLINDDLIVDGSACIGFDCVDGEAFGFDTIRVKEHNLRIKFLDTSTAASFPGNDWQLTANDSANGGASKFSIDDITGGRTPFTVEAGARSHSLYVDDGGRIGSRTSTPSTEIHTVDGDTPTLRLQQDGSSGFAPQTWDVAGNETHFFFRDITNGSTLPFRIRPGAPTSSIDIASSGSVGINETSPDARVHAKVASASVIADLLKLENIGAGGGVRWTLVTDDTEWRNTVAKNGLFSINTTALAGNEFTIHPISCRVTVANDLVVGGSCSGCTSDLRLKSEVETLPGALEKIRQIRGVRFNWTKEADQNEHFPGPQIGVIAQEVASVFPELVGVDSHGYGFVRYQKLVAPLIEAVKELDTRNSELRKENDELRELVYAQTSAMREQNSQLRELVCLEHSDAPFCG